MRDTALALVLALLGSVLFVTGASAHHVNEIDIDVSCQSRVIVLDISHDIHSGHKLEWEVSVDGRRADSGLQAPDSRYSTSIRVSGVLPYGTGRVEARARATYPNGSPESEWVSDSSRYDCDRPPQTVEVDIQSKHMLCGDPRGWNRLYNRGDVPVLVSWSFVDGNKAKPWKRIDIQRWVDPGRIKTLGARWMRGKVIVRAQNPDTREWKRLYAFRIGKDVRPYRWKTNGCPKNRFGTPAFAKAQKQGRWQTTIRTFSTAR